MRTADVVKALKRLLDDRRPEKYKQEEEEIQLMGDVTEGAIRTVDGLALHEVLVGTDGDELDVKAESNILIPGKVIKERGIMVGPNTCQTWQAQALSSLGVCLRLSFFHEHPTSSCELVGLAPNLPYANSPARSSHLTVALPVQRQPPTSPGTVSGR